MVTVNVPPAIEIQSAALDGQRLPAQPDRVNLAPGGCVMAPSWC